MIHFLNTHPE